MPRAVAPMAMRTRSESAVVRPVTLTCSTATKDESRSQNR